MPPRLLVIENDASDPPGRLGDWLAELPVEIELLRPHAGDALPAELDPAAGPVGVIVLGGAMGANDDASVPWLAAEKALLRHVVSAQIPTLAICLGAQLLAAANGGRVRRMDDGPELGAQLVAKRTAAATDPLFAPLPITPDVIQWHYDAITTLPPGAVLLAGSPQCENQAFRLGRYAWGVQFHIETTPEIIRAWAAEDAADLADWDLDTLVARTVAAHDDVAEVWQPFVAAFVDVVADPASVAEPEAAEDPMAAARAMLAREASSSRAAPLPMPGLRPPEA